MFYWLQFMYHAFFMSYYISISKLLNIQFINHKSGLDHYKKQLFFLVIASKEQDNIIALR